MADFANRGVFDALAAGAEAWDGTPLSKLAKEVGIQITGVKIGKSMATADTLRVPRGPRHWTSTAGLSVNQRDSCNAICSGSSPKITGWP